MGRPPPEPSLHASPCECAADLDADGTVVKTPAWDEMAELMNAELPYSRKYATMTWGQRISNQLVLAAEQLFKVAPPASA